MTSRQTIKTNAHMFIRPMAVKATTSTRTRPPTSVTLDVGVGRETGVKQHRDNERIRGQLDNRLGQRESKRRDTPIVKNVGDNQAQQQGNRQREEAVTVPVDGTL